MAAMGLPVSIAGVAQAYQDFLDVLLVNTSDSEKGKELEHSELRVHCTNIMMRTEQEKAHLAREVLSQVAYEATANFEVQAS